MRLFGLFGTLLLFLVGCKSDAERARAMLTEAQTLLRQGKLEQSEMRLNEIVAKYGHTPEATEANRILYEFDAAKEEGRIKEKHNVETALETFWLDTNRWPTEQEGLKVLLNGENIPNWHGPYWPPKQADVLGRFEYHLDSNHRPEVRINRSVPATIWP